MPNRHSIISHSTVKPATRRGHVRVSNLQAVGIPTRNENMYQVPSPMMIALLLVRSAAAVVTVIKLKVNKTLESVAHGIDYAAYDCDKTERMNVESDRRDALLSCQPSRTQDQSITSTRPRSSKNNNNDPLHVLVVLGVPNASLLVTARRASKTGWGLQVVVEKGYIRRLQPNSHDRGHIFGGSFGTYRLSDGTVGSRATLSIRFQGKRPK